MSVDIVIVNWNSGKQLYNCLSSIRGSDRKFVNLSRVVVVDNASSDQSIQGLGELHLPIQLIGNTQNRGFGAACNQGARGSKADYLIFLNPDTVLNNGALGRTIEVLNLPESSGIGIAGIQLLNSVGSISRSCARFPTPGRFIGKMLGLDKAFPKRFPSHFMSEWDHRESRYVDQVIGAFFLVRRCLFEELGGFDERFFVYFEEVDFALRARNAGWRSYYFHEAQAYHKGGGTSEQVKAARLFYSLRSRILFAFKHFSRGAAASLMLATLLLEPLSRLVYAVAKGSRKEIVETARGYIMLWKDAPEWIRRIGERA